MDDGATPEKRLCPDEMSMADSLVTAAERHFRRTFGERPLWQGTPSVGPSVARPLDPLQRAIEEAGLQIGLDTCDPRDNTGQEQLRHTPEWRRLRQEEGYAHYWDDRTTGPFWVNYRRLMKQLLLASLPVGEQGKPLSMGDLRHIVQQLDTGNLFEGYIYHPNGSLERQRMARNDLKWTLQLGLLQMAREDKIPCPCHPD